MNFLEEIEEDKMGFLTDEQLEEIEFRVKKGYDYALCIPLESSKPNTEKLIYFSNEKSNARFSVVETTFETLPSNKKPVLRNFTVDRKYTEQLASIAFENMELHMTYMRYFTLKNCLLYVTKDFNPDPPENGYEQSNGNLIIFEKMPNAY